VCVECWQVLMSLCVESKFGVEGVKEKKKLNNAGEIHQSKP